MKLQVIISIRSKIPD